MNLKKILSKFDAFSPKTDCLLMLGDKGRFSYYAPDSTKSAETGQALADNVKLSLVMAYLCGHQEEQREVMEKLIEKAVEWVHQTKDKA